MNKDQTETKRHKMVSKLMSEYTPEECKRMEVSRELGRRDREKLELGDV